MPSPSVSSSTSLIYASGNLYIDSLLNEGFLKWGGAVGAGANLSFSFPSVFGNAGYWQSGYSTGEPFAATCIGFNAAQIGAARSALQGWANVANINLTEVVETSSNVGDLRFAFSSGVTPSAWGWCAYPDSYWAYAGDVWVRPEYYASSWAPGEYNYYALSHEIGHGLGLKHPGDYNGTAGSVAAGPFLPAALDARNYSAMSYNDPPNSWVFDSVNWQYVQVCVQTPMVYDIQAIQYLYGANTSYRTGNDTYTFDPGTPFFTTIWDAGGSDTIDVSNYSLGCTINLTPGSYSTIAFSISSSSLVSPPSGGNWFDGTNALGIAFGAVLENATGGSGSDTLIGNDVGNILTGSAGNDSLDGGLGVDTAAYAGGRSGFSIAGTASGFNVSDTTGAEGVDVLVDIERLSFADGNVALDLSGNAGVTAKILGAVFGAPAVANTQFVGIGLGYLDAGMSYEALCELAIAAAGATTHTAIVSLLWNNIVGTPIDPVNESHYVGLLAGGMTVGALAVVAADTAENAANIGLVGLAATGVEYVAVA
jgi:serralysin